MERQEPLSPQQRAWQEQKAEARRRDRRVGAGFLYFGIYWGAQLLVQVPAVVVITVRAVTAMDFSAPDYTALFNALMQGILGSAMLLSVLTNLVLLAALAILFKARGCRFFQEIGARPVPLRALWPLLPLGVALNLFLSGALSLLPEAWLLSYEGASGMMLGGTDALSLFAVIVLAPAAEETLFRGLMYARFRDGMRKFWAMALSSALFGVLHGHPIWMLYAFAMGLLFALLYEWYGSIWASFLAHLAFNGASYLIALLVPNAGPLPLLLAGGALSGLLLWYVYTYARPGAAQAQP